MPALSQDHPRVGIAPLGLTLCVGLFALAGALVLQNVPFPSAYDELQHVSFIAALRDAPTLFPRYGDYRVLSEDLRTWADARNYLAHPPLYYLLLTPFADNIVLLRALNLLMATAGFALCAQAGLALLATTAQRCAFLALLLLFSKPMLIAGMVNNDNLVLLETGLLFRLLVARQARPWAIAIVLAMTGWTKFNAFVGLVFWVGALHGLSILRGRVALISRDSVALAVGVIVGAIPTLANFATLGSATYVPVDFLFVAPDARPHYDFAQFATAFANKVGAKIFFMDGVVNLLPVALAIIACAGFAPFAKSLDSRFRGNDRARFRGNDRARFRGNDTSAAPLSFPRKRESSHCERSEAIQTSLWFFGPPRRGASHAPRDDGTLDAFVPCDIATAAWLATLAFAALHIAYGWSSFRTLGSMSDAQSRYYVMLWPGLSLAAVLGASALLTCSGSWARRRLPAPSTRYSAPDP